MSVWRVLRPQAVSSRGCAPLRDGLTPPPAPGACLGTCAPDFRTAQAPDALGPGDRREAHDWRTGCYRAPDPEGSQQTA